MSQISSQNKHAWEEAFDQSSDTFKMKTKDRLKNDPKSLISPYLSKPLEEAGKKGGRLVHFCCNNGRETSASLAFGFHEVKGIDIAENMVAFANDVAKDLHLNASFEAHDILTLTPPEMPYDVAMFTIGAICWFEDLDVLFKTISPWVKKGGLLILEEAHPVENMLATKNEALYNKDYPKTIVYDYFKKTPWIETTGMGYMTDKTYESKTFTSYTHPMMDIVNGIIQADFHIKSLHEIPVCQGNLLPELNHQGIPLSYVLVAQKHS